MMRMRHAILLLTALVVALGSAVAIAGAMQPNAQQNTKRQRVTSAPAPPSLADASCSVGQGHAHKAQAVEATPAVRFATITVSIDPKGTPLAAYQFELTAGHAFTVVGLDNGGNAAFPGPPRYDRSADADATDRLIVADYSTAGPGQLIAKPYPVATIHAAFSLDEDADAEQLAASIELTLTAAADAGGNRIDADITYDLHFAERPGTE